jgi:hypothetical protein
MPRTPPALDAEPSRVDPTRVAAGEMSLPDAPDLDFEGWSPDVFAMLDRLRETPHIDQYKKEKPGLTEHLKDPFKRYRDDVVVNWVLPNRLDFRTEKNVFSRLLKNDFGAGGCHDNLWMSFYRPGTKRLEDVQISHCISPDGFDVGIYVGAHATDLLDQALSRIQQAPATYLDRINPHLAGTGWRFYYHYGSGEGKTRQVYREPLGGLPDDLSRADGIWLRRRFDRQDVLDWGAGLVPRALDAVLDVWPLYRFYLADRWAA